MSEEEKKAMEYYNGKEFSFTLNISEDKIKEFKKLLGITEDEEDSFENHQIRIQTLLNLISKLQREVEELNKNNDFLRKELKEQDLENQALYESINCNDDNMLARRYKKLQKEIETYKKEIALQGYVTLNYIHKDKIKELLEKYRNEHFIAKADVEDLLKEN